MYKTNCGIVMHIVPIVKFGIVMPDVALQCQFFFADVGLEKEEYTSMNPLLLLYNNLLPLAYKHTLLLPLCHAILHTHISKCISCIALPLNSSTPKLMLTLH